ncbi:DUF2162 domain-containing protein [Methanobrevibacter woesei]|uniref:DUF2162 domain-containing protein n=1 Tax=Methanobrevibacter woesei TaxID=190976 RepID=UPI0023F289F5|nr:DUF2162 domain-containing protein [Methanobrevibacter woesei]
MDVMSLLWQVGIIASVVVFGIKIGLASGLANLSKKLLAIICIGYGGGVLLISWIASFYADQIIQAIYGYNSLFYLIMASIMIIAGLFTIREWKQHDKNTTTATCLAVVAPCPCCFGSIIASVLMVAPTVGLGSVTLSVYVGIALVVTILVTYFASNLIIRVINKPYPIVLGNFMLFLGAYFLLSSLVIPNIASVMQSGASDLSIGDPITLLYVLVIIVILLVVGYLIYRKTDNLLN